MPISPMPREPIGREDRVLLVEPLGLDAEDVGVRGDVVAREVLGHHVAEARVAVGLLEEAGREPHDQAAEELGAGGHRVDHSAHGVDAEQPRHPQLASPPVDPHLGEDRTEGVRGVLARSRGSSAAEAVVRQAGIGVVAVVGAEALGRRHDRRAPRAGARRPARHRGRRQRGVGDLQPDAGRRRPRGRRRRSAAARCGRRCRCRPRRSPPRSGPPSWEVTRALLPGIRIAGYVAAATPVPTHQSPSAVDRGSAGRSAQPNRSAPALEALHQPPAAERLAGLRVDLRLVADAQLDRVDRRTPRRARPSRPRGRTCRASPPAPASTTARRRRAGPAGGRCDGSRRRTSSGWAQPVCSPYSFQREVCSSTWWSMATSRPSRWAPRRNVESVLVR